MGTITGETNIRDIRQDRIHPLKNTGAVRKPTVSKTAPIEFMDVPHLMYEPVPDFLPLFGYSPPQLPFP